MGGARCGGGCRCGGPVGYIFVLGNRGIHFLYWRYVGEKLSQIFSNFLKFALFLQNFAKNFRGARCGRSVGYIFSIGNFGGKKIISNYLFFSQIFSNFLGIHFYVLAMAENYLKLSLFFSNFLKISQIFSNYLKISHLFVSNCLNFFNQIFAPNDGVQIGWGVQVGSGCRIQSLYWWHIGKNVAQGLKFSGTCARFCFLLIFIFQGIKSKFSFFAI